MGSRIDRMLVVLLLCSVGYNIYQAQRPAAPSAPSRQYNSLKMAGRAAPQFVATDRQGQEVVIRTDGVPMLLYALQPGCKYCEANTENMQVMWRQLSGKYRFVGLNLAGDQVKLDDYLKAHPLPFEVLSIDLTRVRELETYSFGATPSLYLVSESKIQRAWAGAFSHLSQADIEQVFSIKIPGAPL